MFWYVLYTRPNSEKKVAEQLTRIGLDNYCPLVTKMRQWSDRKKKVQSPLFTSYVFVKLEEKDRNRVFEVSGVVRYLFWLGKPAQVSDAEIEIINQWLSDDTADVYVEKFSVGSKIRLDGGPFAGHEGTIIEVKNNTVQLVLESLGVILTVQR